MNKKKSIKRFRQISHPRNNLVLTQDAKNRMKSEGRVVPDVNPEAVHMELLNYFDPYDGGLDIGNKDIKRYPKIEKANNLFFKWKKKPSYYNADYLSRHLWHKSLDTKRSEVSNAKFNADKVYEHITNQKKRYYTTNPFCQIRILGGDIDNETSDPDAVLPLLHLLQPFYPGTPHDSGSSGKSLHYYPKIDMLLLYEYYIKNPSITCGWAEYANKIIAHTSRIFNIYSRNILCPEHKLVLKTRKNGKTKLKPEYFVKFDAFKGSYPEYDFYYNKEDKVVIKKMTKRGVLHKYPNIFSIEDLISFRDAPVYSITHHLSVSIYLCNQILLSGSYSDKDYEKLRKAQKDIEPILEAHAVLLPLSTTSLKASKSSPPNSIITKKKDKKKLSIYNGTFEDVDDIALESDALIRSRRYLYYCYKEYILKEGREPTPEEFAQDYRHDVGTGPEDAEDAIRLKYIYDTNIERMRKYIFGSLSKQISKMEESLPLTQDEIGNNHSYHRTLWKREVAITAVWIDLCLTNKDYLKKKKWWSARKGEHFSRELTVPMNALENFIECLKEKGLNKNGCKDNHSKAKALREIVEQIVWMQCVDDTVVIAAQNGGKNGRARRYILLPAHPNYKRFEKLVGVERIEYWKEFRRRQLRDRKLKQRSKKVG